MDTTTISAYISTVEIILMVTFFLPAPSWCLGHIKGTVITYTNLKLKVLPSS